MKNNLITSVFAIFATLLAVDAFAASPIGTTCYIHLARPCINNPGVLPNMWFVDNDPGSHIDGARCIQRATEWYNYCGNPFGDQTVYSATNVTVPVVGGEANLIFSYRNVSGAAVYGPLGKTILPLK